MAISFPRELPNISEIQNTGTHSRNVIAASTSPFSLIRQVQEHQGQRWEIDFQLVVKDRANMAKWAAWLVSMEGINKTFLSGDPASQIPRGSAQDAPGTPLVDGASQTGDSLSIKGAPNSAPAYLLEGDFIQLGTGSTSRMYMVLEDVSTDGSGDATITIWPNLRSSPADNAAVTVSNAKSVFSLGENVSTWDVQLGHLWVISFTAIEAL